MERVEDLKPERYLTPGDKEFPSALKSISYVPQNLYYRGDLPDPGIPSVGIIGARECTEYGEAMARRFAGELAEAGVQIISGAARGVDGIAQRAAIDAGGKSFGILGCGTDVVFPRQNRELYELLIKNGGLLSEYPAGTPPRGANFPLRNRIISALSDVLLVIEAKQKSGTMITVEFALEQGKDVFVLPGRLNDDFSIGCNLLARQGAMLALDPGDILEHLYGKGKLRTDPAQRRRRGEGKSAEEFLERQQMERQRIRAGLTKEEMEVYDAIGSRSTGIHEICARISQKGRQDAPGFPEVANLLMSLWSKGVIYSENGGRYRTRK